MSDAGTRIMGAGLIDEGVEYERMEKEIKLLKAKLSTSRPVCPHCHAEMTPFKYKGYYESHVGWSCDCDKIPDAEQWNGRHA